MDNEKRRRQRNFFEKVGGFTHISTVQENCRMCFSRIERTEDWERVPNFFSGPPERSDLMKQLTLCIIQLQAEVDRLRKGQE